MQTKTLTRTADELAAAIRNSTAPVGYGESGEYAASLSQPDGPTIFVTTFADFPYTAVFLGMDRVHLTWGERRKLRAALMAKRPIKPRLRLAR